MSKLVEIAAHYGTNSLQVEEARAVIISAEGGLGDGAALEFLDSIYNDGTMWRKILDDQMPPD